MAELREGLVICHLGKGIAVETPDGLILCQPKRRLETVAVGDRVLWQASGKEQGSIESILPRKSLLSRPSRNNQVRPVAANIDQVFVVFSTQPNCDFLLIDQYLAVCENRNIKAALVFNKIDLGTSVEIENELACYQQMAYPIFRLSAGTNEGLAEFKQALLNQVSILSGQSGVGKSSLTNALIPDKAVKINSISENTKLGRHTTTTATLYHLPRGGDLIDSPGVAIFGLAGLSEQELAFGFRDFQPWLGKCRFNDCRHIKDKDCAVREAVETGRIAASRYQRFLKLKEKMLIPEI